MYIEGVIELINYHFLNFSEITDLGKNYQVILKQ